MDRRKKDDMRATSEGMVRVQLRVPEEFVEYAKAYAAALRSAKKLGLPPPLYGEASAAATENSATKKPAPEGNPEPVKTESQQKPRGLAQFASNHGKGK